MLRAEKISLSSANFFFFFFATPKSALEMSKLSHLGKKISLDTDWAKNKFNDCDISQDLCRLIGNIFLSVYELVRPLLARCFKRRRRLPHLNHHRYYYHYYFYLRAFPSFWGWSVFLSPVAKSVWPHSLAPSEVSLGRGLDWAGSNAGTFCTASTK